MQTKILKPKKIVGLEIKTSNQDGRAMKDIPPLWQRFYSENLKNQIENRVSDVVYGLYTNYEGDHTQPYSLIVGYEVEQKPEKLPVGCSFYETQESSYVCIPTEGAFPDGLIEAWNFVWGSKLKRRFTHDFEVYDETFDPTSGSSSGVHLYIAVE